MDCPIRWRTRRSTARRVRAHEHPRSPAPRPFSGYQKVVVGMLAFLQFAVILDFMLMSPLGALIMPALSVTPAQFGTVVSAYAFAAGISGLLTAGFADRFDRKKLLLFFYTGFIARHAVVRPRAELRIAAARAHRHRTVRRRHRLGRARHRDRPVRAADARPRDGLHPDGVRRQPDPRHPHRHLSIEPLELARAVPRAGGARHRSAAC